MKQFFAAFLACVLLACFCSGMVVLAQQDDNGDSLGTTTLPGETQTTATTQSTDFTTTTGTDVTETTTTQAETTTAIEETTTTQATTQTTKTTKTTRTTKTTAYQGNNSRYTLTLKAGANGSVNTNVSGRYRYQDMVSLKATPAKGYVFEKWVATGGLLLDPYAAETEFYMPAGAATVTAQFMKQPTVTETNPAQEEEDPQAPVNTDPKQWQAWPTVAIIAAVLVLAALAALAYWLWCDHKKLR